MSGKKQIALSVTLPAKMIELMKETKREIGINVSRQIELKLKGFNLCERHDITAKWKRWKE